MTDNQLAVILFGLMAGYWIVSRLLNRKRDDPTTANATGREERQREEPGPERHRSKETWSEVLGTSSSAGVDEIRRAYKELIVQYHPDKVANLGRELRDLAEEKSKNITMAYRQAMRARGVDR